MMADQLYKIYRKLSAAAILCLLFQLTVIAQVNVLSVSDTETGNSFPLVDKEIAARFFYDAKDAAVVKIAAAAFVQDVKAVTGIQIQLSANTEITGEYAVIAGTIGHSSYIDALIASKKINITAIQHGWERFSITILEPASSKIKKLLVIAGSDRRGTAFGIFHLSRILGVSPFVWWADIAPVQRKQLFVSGSYISSAPSVKFRGIFINDEDWGLQPWAAKHLDTAIKDIGPNTYTKVFELMLRLKANYIWPAMHPCTKAFYYYKENPKVADDYAIMVGGSHCEPMLRNNVFEWAENYEHEYGKQPGEWRYDVNKAGIYKYWDDRVKEAVNFESVYTVGMRGVHDGSMPGPKDPDEKLKLLQTVIEDQRKILNDNFSKPASLVPQIFVPYKEVLSLYRRGLKLDEDITIIWPDDNYGYIRQLPNATERIRSGGNGVYYHLSYWGAPQDYLWLSSISPSLIAYEMEKAYNQGARKCWIFNVGDIKPAELELQFALDMAWDIEKRPSANAYEYTKFWAAEIFGDKLSHDIAAIKNEYYLLAASGKPEHINTVDFTAAQMQERLNRYKVLDQKAQALKKMIPASLQDAYFQLVLYPVMGARLINEKILYARKSFQTYHLSLNYEFCAERSKKAFDSIQLITAYYNKEMAAGKWDGMMSWHPRDQAVFKMPVLYTDADKTKKDSLRAVYFKTRVADFVLNAVDASNITETASTGIRKVKGLGITDQALVSFAKENSNNDTAAAFMEWDIPLTAGRYEVVVKCLPVFDVNTAKYLRYMVSVNDDAGPVVNVHAEADSKVWKENVTRGYSMGASTHTFKSKNKLRLYIKDTGLVINTIEFYRQ